MRKLVVSLVGAVTLFAAPVGPLHAITFGEPDGDAHPNVGSIVVDVPSLGISNLQWCSGTLIDADVFLTASHCTAPFDDIVARFPDTVVKVTFDPTISAGGTFYEGEWITNPAYNGFQGKGGRSDPGDVAVILLDDEPGIEPASLPEEGLLDDLQAAKILKNTRFTAVGYGSTRDRMTGGLDPIDFTNLDRNRAEQGFNSLTKSWLHLPMMNTPGNENGGTCYGDSGGPHFIHLNGVESDIVVSVTVTGDLPCKASDVTYRVDTPAARAFLAGYVDLP